MSTFDYSVDDTVAIITMNSEENRFNPTFLKGFRKVLDQVERESRVKTTVVRSAHEKIFSNGIDLEWLVPVLQKNDLKAAKKFFYQLNDLFKRLLTYPMITIAAINGHAFAGGAIMSCAFDFRFMRSDRGFFCFPEVDLGIPLLPGMNALMQKAVPAYKIEEMQYTGVRLAGFDCQEHHIVRKACPLNELMDETLEFAHGLKKDRSIVREMKLRLNRKIVQIMDVEDMPYIESGQYHIA
ncbi:MAG: enoyl-CoA hydratase/isomerase family protein [Deltaproteobacteria bacterium]|nr:enoyl-CoA hydratase/isomerase family protein [Deltaproteobacteria bacterium]